jgi:hypothetical protein
MAAARANLFCHPPATKLPSEALPTAGIQTFIGAGASTEFPPLSTGQHDDHHLRSSNSNRIG